MLTFNSENHEYRNHDGKIVPSVTEIIHEWLKVTIGGEKWHVNRFTGAAIPSRKMEEGAAKGTDLHKAAQLILQGGIDWDSLAAEYVGPLKQFTNWLKECDITPLYTEYMFYHSRYNYCGTIDIVATSDKELLIVDIKTGLSDMVSLQLSAYEQGFISQEKYTGKTARYALYLPKSGKPYKFEKMKDDNSWEQFRACLLLQGMGK
jgi:hypothetical protein